MKSGANYVSSLWLASAKEPRSARQLTSGAFADSSPVWHPDGNRILFFSDRAAAGNKAGVWSLRLDGGDAIAITPTEAEQSVEQWKLSPDGKTVAFLAGDEKSEKEKTKGGDDPRPYVWGEEWEFARLRLVDVETKQTKVLVREDRHIVDMSWSRDGKSITFRSNSNTEYEEPAFTGGTVSTVDVDSGAVKDLCTIKGEFLNLEWAADGKLYFMGVSPMGEMFGGFAIFSVDPAQDSPSFVRVAYGEQDDAISIRIAGDKLLAKREMRLGSIISEVGGDDLFAFEETELGDWDVFFDPETGSASLATSFSTINAPDEVFVMGSGKDKVQLSEFGKPFQGRTFGTYKILTCQSADGVAEIDAIYLTPVAKHDSDGKPKKPLPTLVSIHGGPTIRDNIGFDATSRHWSAYALSQGYGLLLPQYRGSSGRGEKFGAYNSRNGGKYHYDDVITLTDFAVKQGFADPKRLIVGGWSQGGFVSYLCAVRNGLHGLGWKFQACIAGAGITDWDSLCTTSIMGGIFQPELTAGGRAPWMTRSDDTTGRQGSALWEMTHAVEEAKRMGQMVIPPVLILHGANDVQCSTSQAVAFHHGARRHGLTCEFVRYPGEGHNVRARCFKLDVLERLGRWCYKYIGGGQELESKKLE